MGIAHGRRILAVALGAALVSPAAPASAASTSRVEDIDPGVGSSQPGWLTPMKVGTKRLLFFVADEGAFGRELWRSDGTAAGTKLVKDINPGAGGSDPAYLTVMKVGDKPVLFFRAYDPAGGEELWRSDGTAAGTRRVKDILPGGGGSDLSQPTVMKVGTKHVLFFSADDGTSGYELWRSDGSAAGTKRVKDISPGGASTDPYDLTVMKVGTRHLLFFSADDGTSGYELWRSDGSSAGTKRVKDIASGAAEANPYDLAVMKVGTRQVLFFSANDGSRGHELWRSDGSAAGTKRVKDIRPGSGGSNLHDVTAMKVGTRHLLFFSADDGTSGYELWRSDGSSAGTKRVKDIVPGIGSGEPYYLTAMKLGAKRVLFFRAYEASSGMELWRSDGTAAGTKRVKDINSGAGGSSPAVLTPMKVGTKRILFFRADEGSLGAELWRSDGTAAGTRRVKDIKPGSGHSWPEGLTPMKVGTTPTLFFSADDGLAGYELWRHRP